MNAFCVLHKAAPFAVLVAGDFSALPLKSYVHWRLQS